MQNRDKYLTHLVSEFRKYHLMTDANDKEKMKIHLHGFMQAGRILGVSFTDLQQVVDQEKENIDAMKVFFASEDIRDIPAFIREGWSSAVAK